MRISNSIFAMAMAVALVAGCGDNSMNMGTADMKKPPGDMATTGGADMTVVANLTCSEVVQCQNMCTSSKCLSDCLKKGTTTAQMLNKVLDDCISATCADPQGDAAAGRCPGDGTPAGDMDCERCVSNSQRGTDDMVSSAKNGMCMPVTGDAACGKCVKELIDCANDA
jgi:hypothetical protein